MRVIPEDSGRVVGGQFEAVVEDLAGLEVVGTTREAAIITALMGVSDKINAAVTQLALNDSRLAGELLDDVVNDARRLSNAVSLSTTKGLHTLT